MTVEPVDEGLRVNKPVATTGDGSNIASVDGIAHGVVGLVDQSAGFRQGDDLFKFAVVLLFGIQGHGIYPVTDIYPILAQTETDLSP